MVSARIGIIGNSMDYGTSTANELAEVCADAGNEKAWREFIRRFQRPIALIVLRTARGWGEPSSAVIDDLVQDTFVRLCADDCRLLRAFVPQQPDSIFGYVKKIAANVTHDHFRAHKSEKRGGNQRRFETDTDATETLEAPAAEGRKLDTQIQLNEFDRLLRSGIVPERDRTIFWLHYRQGYTAREIAGIPAVGLTVKGVESLLYRTVNLLRDAVREKSERDSRNVDDDKEGR